MENFELYTIMVGLNDKNLKIQVIDTETAVGYINKIVAQYFECGTVSMASGVYKHENGTVVLEKSVKIEVINFGNITLGQVKKFCDILKDALNQESIAVMKSKVKSALF